MNKSIKIKIQDNYRFIPIVDIYDSTGYINYYKKDLIHPDNVEWSIKEECFIIHAIDHCLPEIIINSVTNII